MEAKRLFFARKLLWIFLVSFLVHVVTLVFAGGTVFSQWVGRLNFFAWTGIILAFCIHNARLVRDLRIVNRGVFGSFLIGSVIVYIGVVLWHLGPYFDYNQRELRFTGRITMAVVCALVGGQWLINRYLKGKWKEQRC